MEQKNKKILFLDNNIDLRELITMKLEAELSALVEEFDQENELLSQLEKNQPSSLALLIISDEIIELEKAKNSKLLVEYKAKYSKTPLLIMADEQNLISPEFVSWTQGLSFIHIIKRPLNDLEFITLVKNAVGGKSIAFTDEDDYGIPYTGVKIKNFLRFNAIPCDAFIRLNKIKFIKLINQGDLYGNSAIKKYISKDVQKLYVKTEDYSLLANAAMKSLLALYDKSKKAKGSDIHVESLESIHKNMQNFGLTPAVAELTKKTIESSIQMVKKSKDIGDLLNKMKKSGDYLYEHSMMISYIATAIAKNTEWGSDATAFKLSLAAMMHDMTLEDHAMAKIQTLDDPNLSKYSPERLEKYKNHPLDAAKLISVGKEFPPDVDFIVAQHHERPDGSGFPRGLSKLRIAPLSCVFILAHVFVTKIEELGGDFSSDNREVALKELSKEMFTTGNFKKPFEGLLKIFNQEELFAKKSGLKR